MINSDSTDTSSPLTEDGVFTLTMGALWARCFHWFIQQRFSMHVLVLQRKPGIFVTC